MRVLTDPVEIRAFRKRQIRKIFRMMREGASQNIVKSWFLFRRFLVQVSVMTALIALWIVLATVVAGCGIFFLKNFTVNW